MFDGFKRLFNGPAPTEPPEWQGIIPWAEARNYAYRAVHDNQGFVIDGHLDSDAWRLEWGPSQRPYIAGYELRLRAELGLLAELQLVVMNRELQEAMEKAVYEQFVEGVQTRIDNQTPPEMRWLVMYPKLSSAEMPLLRERYVALASLKRWLVQWLDGPMTDTLAALTPAADVPFVLMIGRGRLMLRTALPDAHIGAVQGWLRVFEVAMREARRVACQNAPGGGDSVSPASSQWPPSALPGDERNR